MTLNSFFQAVKDGQMEQVEACLEVHPEFIDTPNEHTMMTPLHWAATNGHTSMTELLLRRGSHSINALTKYGMTPLHCAVTNGNTSLTELLLRWGSRSIDAPTTDGMTPLHYAAWNGCTSMAELLLREGSQSFNARTKIGNTPLHCAVSMGHGPMVELLLRVSASGFGLHQYLNAANTQGSKPLDFAIISKQKEIVCILKAIGATTTSNLSNISSEQIQILCEPIPEAEVLAIRKRIYFDHTLVSILLPIL